MRPDITAIKQLSAYDVAQTMSLIDTQSQGWGKSARYRFAGYEGSHWIQFYDDGAWYDHKHNIGGDCISLVMAYLDGAPNFDGNNRALFVEAVREIAGAFGAWQSITDERAKGRALAEAAAVKGQGQRTYYGWLEAQVRAVVTGQGGEAWAESCRLLDALGIDPEVITLCPYPAPQGAALCWQPAVPWQGVRVSTKLKDGREVYGGWTKERAQAHLHTDGALSVVALDFDGRRGEQPLKARADLVQRLVFELGRRGLPVAAHVWSTVEETQGEERAKAHLYFVSDRPAPTPQVWQSWWALIAHTVDRIVAGWKLPAHEEGTFTLDEGTEQLTRLLRLPGFGKHGADFAAVLASADPSARVHFAALLERRDLEWTYTQEDGSKLAITLGHECIVAKSDADGVLKSRVTMAKALWPLAEYWTPDRQEHGVLVRVEDRRGQVQHLPISAANLVDKRGYAAVSRTLAGCGAQLYLRHTETLAKVIGDAYSQGRLTAGGMLVRRSGWHGSTYVQGREVYGDGAIYPDSSHEAIRRRDTRAGTLEGWRAEVMARCTTHALKLALGVSLAGALLHHLGAQPFLLHVAGPSSIGKSSVAQVAASVWGAPNATGMYHTWDATMRAFEGLAEMAQDAGMVLDEIGRFGGTPEELAGIIHTLGGSGGRARMQADGELQRLRHYRCTTISTGEVELATLLGDHVQGGHMVRALDLMLLSGEASTDGAHADAIRQACQAQHGVVGGAWVDYLSRQDWPTLAAQLSRIQEQLLEAMGADASGETRRMVALIALTQLALEAAGQAGLTSWSDAECMEVGAWATARIVGERARRREDTPERRALKALLHYVIEDEGHAPYVKSSNLVEDLSARLKGPVGIREQGLTNNDFDQLHLVEEWLKASPVCKRAGVNTRAFLRWLVEEGLCEEPRLKRLPGQRRRFWSLNESKAFDYIDSHQHDDVTLASVTRHTSKESTVTPMSLIK